MENPCDNCPGMHTDECDYYRNPCDKKKEYDKACAVIDDAFNTKSQRKKTLLVVRSLEELNPTEEGVELNVGYEFDVDGPLPEVADGIAKMAKELDKMQPNNAGAYFIELINQFYKKA